MGEADLRGLFGRLRVDAGPLLVRLVLLLLRWLNFRAGGGDRLRRTPAFRWYFWSGERESLRRLTSFLVFAGDRERRRT